MNCQVFVAVFLSSLVGCLGQDRSSVPTVTDYSVIQENKVREDVKLGDYLGTVSAFDPDGTDVTYELTDDCGQFLAIGTDTGDVTIKSLLNFEEQIELKCTLTVKDEQGQSTERFGKIQVLDVNDELPVFAEDAIEETLDEDTQPGYVISAIIVTDVDTTNDVFNLVCAGTTDDLRLACETFELVTVSNSNQGWQGYLALVGSLDFETIKSYVYPVLAYDGENEVINEVHIKVRDINDSPPRWQRTGPRRIDEEEPIGFPITTVTATDGDETNPRAIAYDLIGEHTDVFTIGETTGVISLLQVLDFDADSSRKDTPYDVTIRAREIIESFPNGTIVYGDSSADTATVEIKITIQDINDNAPQFFENGQPQDSYTAYIEESIANGLNIPGLLMTVTDKDHTSEFNTFRLETSDYHDTFRIIPTVDSSSTSPTLYVVDTTNIDYEAGPRLYEIEVTATEELTNPAFTGSATVTIHVVDVNDQTPQFEQEEYEAYVPERAEKGYPVIRITANDSEAGPFGDSGIVYELFGNTQDHFDIVPLTGQVIVKECEPRGAGSCIDYEEKDIYVLSVSATDNYGVEGLTNSVKLTIYILDENDNVPQIDASYLRFIYEEKTVTVNPLIIQAVDPDTVEGGVTYSISGDTSNLWQITLGNQDGFTAPYANITAKRGILYSDAINGEFNFNVIATDTRESSIATVTIIVLDINNNGPQFLSPLYRASFSEDTGGDYSVQRVYARDLDSPTTDNGIIDFSIRSGGVGKFYLDNLVQEVDETFSVAIYTLAGSDFDYDLQQTYSLILECRDRGTPTLTGTTTLTVTIIDINNRDPVLTPTSATINVREDSAIGASVHTLQALDSDERPVLVFRMTATSADQPTGAPAEVEFRNLFTLEASTGIVRVNGPLNRETVSFIVNDVEVEDLAAATPEPQIGRGALYIRITEVNDQDPEFVIAPYNISLNEEKSTNSFVQTLECFDEDDRIVDYDLRQVFPQFPQYFALIPDTGAVIVNERMDYDEANINYIELSVSCFDSGVPQRSSTTNFYVYVLNINDNSPQFLQNSYLGELYEGTVEVEEYILTVTATDIDRDDYGEVRYHLADSENFFRIDEITGQLYVKQGATFDRETSARYDFQVFATDSPLDPDVRRESTVPVYIQILDINDNCPVFVVDSFSRVVAESLGRYANILDIDATDADIGENAQMRFEIQPNSGDPPEALDYFQMEQGQNFNYGQLITSRSLKDLIGFMSFNVTATDLNGDLSRNPCITVVGVTIEIKESQNDAPEWIRPPRRDYVIYVLESQYNGMLVYNSKAEDINEGPSGVVDYYFYFNNNFVANTSEFRMNRITGVIRADVVFDREQVDRYFLTLMARDQGEPAATSETTLTVVILDVDDNDPKFVMKDDVVVPLVLSTPENAVGDDGTLLGNCSYLASDADSDHENNKIYYRLLTTNEVIQEHIEVTLETCEIFLKKAVDYEMYRTLEFDILAYNEKNDDTVIRYQKREVNPSILPVVVNFIDDNDNAPVFEEDHYLTCASIDTSYRETLLQVVATDIDSEDTQGLQYSLPDSVNGLFAIDSDLGTIYNLISFRYQGGNVFQHDFQVQAMDAGGLTGQTQVTIFITANGNLVKVKVDRPRVDVEPFQQLLARSISANADGEIDFICIDSITNHVHDDGTEDTSATDVYLMAARRNLDGSVSPIPADELSSMIDSMITTDNNLLQDIYVSSVEAKSDDDDWDIEEDEVLAIFIICILLIVLAIILIILACYCIHKSKNKKVRKLKAERHTVINVEQQAVATSVNPVYSMDGTEYATVQKKSAAHQPLPIHPVVIPAPQNREPEEPEYQPEEDPIPVIEAEVLPDPAPASQPDPVNDETIETQIEDESPGTAQEPEALPPPPIDEGEIDAEIIDTN